MLLTAAIIALGILLSFMIERYVRSFQIKDFASKYILITGCDSGFGKLLSIRLHGLGFHVVAGCMTQKGAEDLEAQCPGTLTALQLDVTDPRSIEAAYNRLTRLLSQGQGLWALVNNAGIGGNTGYIEMCSTQDFQKVLDVNLLGPIEMTRRFLPLVRKARGRLVTITSVMGRYPGVAAPYVTSKFGLEGFCDVLRRETSQQGVKVSIIEPGYFRTAILDYQSVRDEFQRGFEASPKDVQEFYGEATVDKLSGFLSALKALASPDLDPVVAAYVHAITARFPKTRYVVGKDAKFFYVPLSMLPVWISDWIFQSIMKGFESKMKKKGK